MNPPPKRKLLPDISVTTHDGQIFQLWNFRQRTHVTLLYERGANSEALLKLADEAKARQKTWDWLGVKILVVCQMPTEFPGGLYLIDRYGILVNYVEAIDEPWDLIEKEYLYLEARQC